jgi:hypothetical protein
VQLLLIGACVVALLLVVLQLVLPRLAARVVRDRLGGEEQVVSVAVRAVPAVRLLWGRADRIEAHVRTYDARDRELDDELERTAAVGELDLRVERLRAPRGLELSAARLVKRDGGLEGEAVLDPAELAAALPAGVALALVATDDGSVALEGRAGLFGLNTAMRLRVVTVEGRVVVRPENGLLAALATYTLFADDRVEILSLRADPLPDGRFRFRATARVR